MAQNQRYTHGLHIGLTAPTGGVTSGAHYKIGAFVGVAQTSAAAGERFALWLDGSWTLTVTGALTEGQLVYLNTADNTLTNAATRTEGTSTVNNTPFGIAVTAKATGTGPAEVALLGKLAA